jgi:hypothetical protein
MRLPSLRTLAVVAAPAGTVAGSNSAPSPGITAPGLPQSGHVVTANDPNFNPAAALGFTFQRHRCNNVGTGCVPIIGASNRNYTLTDEDIGGKVCATATGKAAGGGTTSDCGTRSDIVLAPNPVQTAPTTMAGNAYVGDTLVSGVGGWKFPGTTYARQWESCNPDGSSCATINGAKAATYLVKTADLGKRLRVRISVDSNGANTFPGPVEVFTPLSEVVTSPPSADPVPTPTPTPQGGNDQDSGLQPPPGPNADTVAPVLQSVKALSAKLKPGAQLKLKVNVCEAGSLSVELQRAKGGRKLGKTCKAGAKKGKKCTVITKIATVNVSGVGGSGTVTLPKRKLVAGDYRAVVTPVDVAGNRGEATTVAFKVIKK